MATNAVFRGLGDTTTPLVWALAFTVMNALLDPFFIFVIGLGAAGAAAGTALAQTLALVPLLLALQARVRAEMGSGDDGGAGAGSARFQAPLVGLFAPPGGIASLGESLRAYAQAGGYVLLRSFAKISAYSVCAREAARLGAVASAAHNLCFQLGVATTQLCESVAIATQTLLARELSRGQALGATRDAGAGAGADVSTGAGALQDTQRGSDASVRIAARHIVGRSLGVGSIIAGSVSLVTFCNRRNVVGGLTTIPEVRTAAIGVMPLVLTCQVLKGVAYPVSGMLMGALDWRSTAAAMWIAQSISVALIAFWSGFGARPLTLNRLWAALAALFATQILAGLLRIASGTGPWAVLRERRDLKQDGKAE